MEAFEKDNLTISIPCDGSPQPVCKWTKDGGNIDTKDGHFTIQQDGATYNLKIKEVTPEDAGTYQVEFTNRAGEKKTSLELNVHCKYHLLLGERKPMDWPVSGFSWIFIVNCVVGLGIIDFDFRQLHKALFFISCSDIWFIVFLQYQ